MSVCHLAEDEAASALGLLHQTEDGEVPVVDLTHERLQALHHQRLRGQDGLILQRKWWSYTKKPTRHNWNYQNQVAHVELLQRAAYNTKRVCHQSTAKTLMRAQFYWNKQPREPHVTTLFFCNTLYCLFLLLVGPLTPTRKMRWKYNI